MPATIAAARPAAYPALLSTRRFLWLTAILLPLCAVLILFLDQPLARFCHFRLAALVPFFAEVTDAAERAYETLTMTHLLYLPLLLLGLAAAYVAGRWVLRQPRALVWLITLLVHLASVGTSNVLKGVVRRLRPEALFSGGYSGLGFYHPGAVHSDSFPSTHTTTFFSLFVPLALAFPRWRAPLLVLPVLIGLGRLVLGMHYPSDVLFSVWLVVFYTFLFGQLFRLPWLTGPGLTTLPAAAESVA